MRLDTVKQWARRMARGCGHGYRWGRVITTVAVLALAALDAWLEIHGLPAGGIEAVQGLLANHGIKVTFREARIGVVNGLLLEDVSLLDYQHASVVMAHAEALGFRPQFTPLLTGHLRPARISFSNLEVYPPRLGDQPATGLQQALPPLRLSGQIRFLRHHVMELAPLSGDAAGIHFQIASRFTGVPYDHWFSGGGTNSDFVCGWDAILAACGQETRQRIQQFLVSYGTSGLPRAEGEIEVRGNMPWNQPEKGSLWGSFSFADLPVRNASVRKLRGQFVMAGQHLRLRQVLLQLAGDQSAVVEADLDLAKRRISGDASGILNPVVLFQLAGQPAPGFLTEVRWGKPLRFEANLQPSFLEVAKMRGTIKFFCEGLFFRNVTVQAAEGRVRFADDQVRLEELSVSGIQYNALRLHRVTAAATYGKDTVSITPISVLVAADGQEHVTGAVTLYLDTGEFAANLTGILRPLRLAESAGVLPASLAGVTNDVRFNGAPPTVRCDLARSPYSPRHWRGQATVDARLFMFRDLNVAHSAATVTLEPGRVNFTAQASLDGTPAQAIAATGVVRTAEGRLSGQLQATLYPDRLARQLRLFDAASMPPLSFNGPPVILSATLADSPLNPAQWHGSGQVTAEQGRYDTLGIRRATSAIRFDPTKIVFNQVDGTTEAGDRLKGDITVALPSGDLSLRGQVIGDPIFAQAFIAAGVYRDRYRRIWRDVVWSKSTPPVIRIDHLAYYNSRVGSDWKFELDLHADATNPRYNSLQANTLAADLRLRLPDDIRVENVKLTADNLTAAANVRIELTDLASCRLDITATGNPRRILGAIEPEWDGWFKDIRFADTTQVECHGGFFIGQESRPRLVGRLVSPACAWRDYPFTNFEAKWLLENTRLSWAPATAKFYEGDLVAIGNYDFDLDAGHLNLTLKRMRLAPWLSSNPAAAKVNGFISGNGALDLLRPDANKPLQINGNGQLWVRDGDLWNLPVLANLGKIIGASSLGKITRADADLVFAGDQVVVPNFTTDGTPVAIGGNGEYSWATDQISFRVRGEALKKTRILPLLLNPFFWFFEAELTGTPQNHNWRLIRHLGDVFTL